jgi:hypothetical protein
LANTADPPTGGCYVLGLKNPKKVCDHLITLELDGKTWHWKTLSEKEFVQRYEDSGN